MSPSSSVAEIAAELVQWELVPAERHNELQALVRECSDRLRWWRLLIERGLLTAYQVNALMNGQLSTLVLGPYRILDRLGSGPTGEVYKARHSALGRTCALKVVDVSKLNAPGLIERFFHEAKLAARLQHPNIVAVYDAGRDGQRCYYAMQYVEGKTLEQLVRDRGTLLAPTACEYVRQVASGLQYAADLGLVHGNLKPSNIVVSRDPGHPDRCGQGDGFWSGPGEKRPAGLPCDGRWGRIWWFTRGRVRFADWS
jgi:serine/threonine protein kinase